MADSASIDDGSPERFRRATIASTPWLEIKDRLGVLVARVVLDTPRMIVGREPTSAIHLDHSTISRQHAEFYRDPFSRWWVRDLHSRNGVKINHQRVAEGLINTGDLVRLGDFHFTLQHAPEANIASAATEACPPLSDAIDLEVSTIDEGDSSQIDAQHLMATMELGAQLRRIADAGQRRREICDFMVGDRFRGVAALVLHVDRATLNRPQVLCSSRYTSAKAHPSHISTTLLRNVMEKGKALMASNARGKASDVEMSIAPEFMRVSAAACPLMNVNQDGMDVFYVAFPPELARPEWLALTSLVATQFEQSESIWSAQRDIAANAAIDNDLRQARDIQQRLVPRDISIPGLDIGISFEPCRWVGGDYVDVVSMGDGRTLLAVADACGKGLQAALVASSVHTMVHGWIRTRAGLGDLMNALNEYLCAFIPPGLFVTMLAVVLESKTGAMEYASAGHPPGMILGRDGQSRDLESTGFPLGISPQPIPVNVDHLENGELLAMFTDGFTEVPGPSGNMLESAEFQRIVLSAWSKSVHGEALHFIQTATGLLGKYIKGASAADDQTFLAVKRTESTTPVNG